MLEEAGADIVEANCWQDPQCMLPTVEEIRRAVKCYMAVRPIAYRRISDTPFFTGQPGFPDKLDSSQLTRYELAEFAQQALDIGVNYIGGCRGAHIHQMARTLGKLPAEERHWEQDFEEPKSTTEAYQSLREKEQSPSSS